MKKSKAQIIATIGPASHNYETLLEMVNHQMDAVRLNFSWDTLEYHQIQIRVIREVEKKLGVSIPVIMDLPGPRIQGEEAHSYNIMATSALTPRDFELVQFGVAQGVEYISVSYVSSAKDIMLCREIIQKYGGKSKIIAKIERQIAVDLIDEIIKVADVIMIARGDLGNEIALEKIPFVQASIIKKCKEAGKPVIVATQMMTSMIANKIPSRADVSDVSNAILQGADAVMLSEESAIGKYPIETVAMMERIVLEAEEHMGKEFTINPL
ncbi:MAG: pyruvate kinase [Candidatus Paceibacterota bacterium]